MADLGFLFEWGIAKQAVGFQTQDFHVFFFWGRTWNFHVGFGGGPTIFM